MLEFFRAIVQGDQAIHDVEGVTREAAGMRSLSTNKIQQISPTMANMQAIGEFEADAWVGYWISKGTL